MKFFKDATSALKAPIPQDLLPTNAPFSELSASIETQMSFLNRRYFQNKLIGVNPLLQSDLHSKQQQNFASTFKNSLNLNRGTNKEFLASDFRTEAPSVQKQPFIDSKKLAKHLNESRNIQKCSAIEFKTEQNRLMTSM